MNVVGIITEFNPFHKGHEYIIKKAKEITNADYCVIITSGNFVQRGEPSFIDKYTKTNICLNNGADLVIELPVQFATASAEYFATCAVTILNNLNIVNYLVFGVENDNLESLNIIADTLLNEPFDFKETLKNELAKGESYPVARAKALQSTLKDDDISFINTPNNILAIEYIKALKKINSTIIPIGVNRINAGYHGDFSSSSVDDVNRLFSATNIRKVDSNDLISILQNIDNNYLSNYKKSYPIYLNKSFSSIAGHRLLQCVSSDNNDFFDVPDYLLNKIKKNISSYMSYESFIETLKTKDISYTTISRALLHITLDIKKTDIESYINNSYGQYIRVLGLKKSALPLLNSIDNKSNNIKIITKVKDYRTLLNDIAIKQFEQGLSADNMYQLISSIDLKHTQSNEFQKKLIIL